MLAIYLYWPTMLISVGILIFQYFEDKRSNSYLLPPSETSTGSNMKIWFIVTIIVFAINSAVNYFCR